MSIISDVKEDISEPHTSVPRYHLVGRLGFSDPKSR